MLLVCVVVGLVMDVCVVVIVVVLLLFGLLCCVLGLLVVVVAILLFDCCAALLWCVIFWIVFVLIWLGRCCYCSCSCLFVVGVGVLWFVVAVCCLSLRLVGLSFGCVAVDLL